MRDLQRPAPCPACSSRNVSILHAARSTFYVGCLDCEHTWSIDVTAVDPLRHVTSPAFRMTARVVARGAALAPAV